MILRQEYGAVGNRQNGDYFEPRAFVQFGMDNPLPIVTRARPVSTYWIHLFDNFGNLRYALERVAIADYDFNRNGGCGQAIIEIARDHEFLKAYIPPKSSIKLYVNGVLRYTGKLLRVKRRTEPGKEAVILTCYGYILDLAKMIVSDTFEGMEVSAIVKSILDSTVVPGSEITYDAADIEVTDYSVSSITFNHTVKDAFAFLADLAGSVEWGVDRNKKFYFKRTDPIVRRVWVKGREVESWEEDRNDEPVTNTLRVFGQDGTEPLVTLSAQLSVNTFGTRTDNVFESAITEVSDANRYGTVILKKLASSTRSIKARLVLVDPFIELTTPLGATAINTDMFSAIKKYGHTHKYGRTNQYGNLKRDQISAIRYKIQNGGMYAEVTLQGDVPNLGDQQKRVEFEIRNLQRR
jgi:hypothetical protein